MTVIERQTQGPAQLTLAELDTLRDCEETIRRGIWTFYEVGRALQAVQLQGLWRGTHRSFEHYCQDRWGYSRQRAHQLMGAGQVAENLSKIFDASAIALRESHVEPLRSLPPDLQREAYSLAWKRYGSDLTARGVKEAVRELSPPEPKALPLGNGAEPEDDGYTCRRCGERHLESVPCKPAPVLNEAGALTCPQDAEGRYLDAAASSPVFTTDLSGVECFTQEEFEAGIAPVVECSQASPDAQETASTPSPQSPDPYADPKALLEDLKRAGQQRKTWEAEQGGAQFVDASTRVVSLEQTALLDAADLTVSDAVEIALRVHAAAAKHGCDVEGILRVVELPSFPKRNRVGAGR